MVRLREFGLESPDLTAAAQQLFVISALYGKDRSSVENYLGLDATIDIWKEIEASYPPSWCVIRQGSDDYFVVIQGTTNAVQWRDHTLGVFWRNDFISGLPANGSWVNQIEGFQRDIISRYGRWPPGRWHFSGHSFGAAMAFLLALATIRDYPENRVGLLNFAQPRAMSTGYTGRLPEPYWRIDSYTDAVPETPPPWASFFEIRLSNPVSTARVAYPWGHYGTAYNINWNGGFNEQIYPPMGEYPEYVSNTFPESHLVRNYAGRLLRWERFNGPAPVMRDALERALAVPYGAVPRNVPWNQPQFVEVPGVGLVLIPQDFTYLNGGGPVAFYKLVYSFRSKGGTQWSETWAMSSTSGVDAASDEALSTPIINARLAILSRSSVFVGLSVSDMDAKRVTRKRTLNANGLWGAEDAKTDISGVAISTKYFGLPGGTRVGWIRGVGDDVVVVNPANGVIEYKTEFLTGVTAMVTALASRNIGWRPRQPVTAGQAATQYNPIISVSGVSPEGYAQITCQNPIPATVGQIATITQCNKKSLPGLDGPFQILAVGGATITVKYQVDNNGTVSNPGGRLRLVTYAPFCVVNGAQAINAIGRRTKNAFSPSRKSQSARGVRSAR